jgi:predicted CXXCH cytochrome family protein
MIFRCILAALAILSLLSLHVHAQESEGCVTSRCHADVGTKQYVHGPVGAGICNICHTLVNEKDHKFMLTSDKEELCFGCHEAKRDMMLEDHLHTPVANGNCVGCHDPHQSDFQYTLKGNAADLCFNCHKKEAFAREFVHGPVGVGDCNVCHNPHASPNEKQLIAPAAEVCYVCHKEKTGITEKRHVHEPVGEKCVSCHDPHSNNAKFMLPENPPVLCFGCHQGIETAMNSSFGHEPVANGKCGECHNSHASDNPRLFPLPQADLCFSCHLELSTYVSVQTYKHGPVRQGDCNACHDPHGSENFRILKKYFPEEFYKPYSDENYAICFECHNRQIAHDAETKTLTDFRDNERNLHYLHVNKDVKGRSCKACHEAHASNQQKHIRKSVPFGKVSWELPVTYTKTENGGSCVVGCHAPKDYGRK